ncbi:MAG: SnoaL-like domain-containing protein [Flavobacteriales bacterium]
METREIANKLVEWCNKGDYDSCYRELYSNDIISIEPGGENPIANGMEEVAKKGAWWKENFEVHSSTVSKPTIADNWFSVSFDMETTHKPSGMRSRTSEIAVYEVKNGKIVKEQFFYDMPS